MMWGKIHRSFSVPVYISKMKKYVPGFWVLVFYKAGFLQPDPLP